MLNRQHQTFLKKYFSPDEHYSKEDAPVAWFQYSTKVTSKDIDRVLNTSNTELQRTVLKTNNITPDHITKVLSDPVKHDKYNRELAAKHLNVTRENLLHILQNPHEHYMVKSAAISNPNYKKYFPNGHE